MFALASTVGLSLWLAAPLQAGNGNGNGNQGGSGLPPQCIQFDGYTPPQYTVQELIGFLSTVPQIAADPTQLFTGFWTNWYTEPTEEGLVKLAVQRGILDAFNLHHAYLPGALTDNLQPGELICDSGTLTARTVDGTCNDLVDPAAGAVYTRFGRNIPLAYAHPDSTTLMTPNPREVSTELLRRKGNTDEIPFLNLWATAWTQFQVHDWFDHGLSDHTRPLSIPLDANDPFTQETGQTHIVIGSTPIDDTRLSPEEDSLPPTYQNAVTHWWDGSQIYGSDVFTASRLRTFQGGKLKLDTDGRLPLNGQGFGDAGFSRNWWLGLEMLHNLFVKEHNAIADHIASSYPWMTDQELYDKARLVNAALIAKIHTLEWTPAVLPNPELDMAMNANWYGLETFVHPAQRPFLAGIFPPDDPVVFGIVGGTADNKGVSYSMTEEFAAVYRMHPLTPEKLKTYDTTGHPGPTIQLAQATDAGARTVFEDHDYEDLAVSFGLAHAGHLKLQNYPRFMTDLQLPTGDYIDLAAIDILRDRERGLPRYNDFRRLLNLVPLSSIDDLTTDQQLRQKLHQVYSDIEEVDLFVGTLAEQQRPDCFGFGETLFQTFILMASRRLQADRFYTDDYRPGVYTQEGLDWVEENTFKSVLLRHHPDLANTDLADVENAFKPWDE